MRPKDPKVPKAQAKAKRRKLVSQVFKTCNQKQARKLRNLCKWDRFTPLTRRGFRMNGVLMNGTMENPKENPEEPKVRSKVQKAQAKVEDRKRILEVLKT